VLLVKNPFWSWLRLIGLIRSVSRLVARRASTPSVSGPYVGFTQTISTRQRTREQFVLIDDCTGKRIVAPPSCDAGVVGVPWVALYCGDRGVLRALDAQAAFPFTTAERSRYGYRLSVRSRPPPPARSIVPLPAARGLSRRSAISSATGAPTAGSRKASATRPTTGADSSKRSTTRSNRPLSRPEKMTRP
jgi:hypothetical protein